MPLTQKRALPALIVSMLVATAPGIAAAAPHAHAAHHRRRHHHHHHHRSAIPQHNGGDHDADNRGGPSDGDGNV